MSTYSYFDDLHTAVPDIPANSIVSRSLLKNEAVDVTLFGFAAGQMLSEHTASRPAMLHFLAGEAQITLGKDAQTAVPGTWVFMPAGLPHSITAQTAVTMLLIMTR
jgi:quercetin dioxygenase-like cupin family protein